MRGEWRERERGSEGGKKGEEWKGEERWRKGEKEEQMEKREGRRGEARKSGREGVGSGLKKKNQVQFKTLLELPINTVLLEEGGKGEVK